MLEGGTDLELGIDEAQTMGKQMVQCLAHRSAAQTDVPMSQYVHL